MELKEIANKAVKRLKNTDRDTTGYLIALSVGVLSGAALSNDNILQFSWTTAGDVGSLLAGVATALLAIQARQWKEQARHQKKLDYILENIIKLRELTNIHYKCILSELNKLPTISDKKSHCQSIQYAKDAINRVQNLSDCLSIIEDFGSDYPIIKNAAPKLSKFLQNESLVYFRYINFNQENSNFIYEDDYDLGTSDPYEIYKHEATNSSIVLASETYTFCRIALKTI